VEGSSLTYSIVATNNGSVSVSGSTATYTPNDDYSGTDTFTYKANDGTVDSNTATVTVTVAAALNSLNFAGNDNDFVSFDPDWSSFTGYTTNASGEGPGIEHFTISTWVKLDDIANNNYIYDMQAGNNSIGDDDILSLGINGSNLQFINRGNGNYRSMEISNPFSATNTWYHILIVRQKGISTSTQNASAEGKGWRIYINGTFTGSLYDGGTRILGDQGMRLGLGEADDRDFDGHIDGFAIWDDWLTQAEITKVYNMGRKGDLTSNDGDYTSSSNLELFFDFNEGTGTTLDDKTGNATQDGTISGAAWVTD
jgi:hypothetical protein